MPIKTVLVLTYAAKSACLVIPLFFCLTVLSFKLLHKLTSAKTRNTVLICTKSVSDGRMRGYMDEWGEVLVDGMFHDHVGLITSWFPGTDKHHAKLLRYLLFKHAESFSLTEFKIKDPNCAPHRNPMRS